MLLKAVLRSSLLVALSVGAFSSFCAADVLTFTATMNGSQETPPNSSPAIGFATVTLNANILTINESYSGLTAFPTAAHIHCCTAPGVAAPVVIPFSGFPGTISGIFSQTVDLSTFSFAGGVTETTFIAGLENGLAYVNIHDANYPGGEIRGQLLQVASTPEPGSLLLLGTGVAGVAGAMKRRASMPRRA